MIQRFVRERPMLSLLVAYLFGVFVSTVADETRRERERLDALLRDMDERREEIESRMRPAIESEFRDA